MIDGKRMNEESATDDGSGDGPTYHGVLGDVRRLNGVRWMWRGGASGGQMERVRSEEKASLVVEGELQCGAIEEQTAAKGVLSKCQGSQRRRRTEWASKTMEGE